MAAGYGQRLRPLTDHIPKPLIKVAGKTLLERHIVALKEAGINSMVVNVAWLAESIADYLGNGSRWGVQIRLSREGEVPLDSGGAMRHALPLLGPAPFLVINGDIICSYPLQQLTAIRPAACHLVLVDNPPHNPQGDFDLSGTQLTNQQRYTYAGIGVFHPAMVAAAPRPSRFSIVPLIRTAADRGEASAEHYAGRWLDIGTQQRLDQARQLLDQKSEDPPC